MNTQVIINKMSYFKWNVIFKKYYYSSIKFRNAINKNKILHDTHKGERCYIVGNGPSLKEMNLNKIRNEFVFTVNSLYRNKTIFNELSSNCHIIVDPSYLRYDCLKAKKLVEHLENANSDIILITEYSENNIYGRFCSDNLYQVYSHRPWTSMPKLDLSSNLLVAQNVVQTAIYTAIYMGFKEIVLIGCEMTSFYENFAANAGHCESYHAYEMTDEDMKMYNRVKDSHDNAYMLQDYAITFDIFKKIRMYTDNRNIRIFNATIGGILDMFPRVNYNEL